MNCTICTCRECASRAGQDGSQTGVEEALAVAIVKYLERLLRQITGFSATAFAVDVAHQCTAPSCVTYSAELSCFPR